MEREIYFAQCGDRIKIGISVNVDARLSQLRTASGGPITLLASVAGNFDIERALHKKLKRHQIDREWYRNCPEVRAAIQNCINNFPAPTVKEIKKRSAAKFKAICTVLWHEFTAEALAEIGDVDTRTARRWLSGENEPPGIVIAAIVLEITRRN